MRNGRCKVFAAIQPSSEFSEWGQGSHTRSARHLLLLVPLRPSGSHGTLISEAFLACSHGEHLQTIAESADEPIA